MADNREQRSMARSGSSERQPLARRSMSFDPIAMNPFSLMRQMQAEMDRAFAQALGGLGGGLSSGGAGGGLAMWAPPIEVTQREGKLRVCAELPGLAPEEVRIEVTPDALVIEGERTAESEVEDGGIQRSELRYGRFQRVIALPEGIDAEHVTARFNNGVLEVEIPIQEQRQQRRQIPIQGSSGAGQSSQGQGQGQSTRQSQGQTQGGQSQSSGGQSSGGQSSGSQSSGSQSSGGQSSGSQSSGSQSQRRSEGEGRERS